MSFPHVPLPLGFSLKPGDSSPVIGAPHFPELSGEADWPLASPQGCWLPLATALGDVPVCSGTHSSGGSSSSTPCWAQDTCSYTACSTRIASDSTCCSPRDTYNPLYPECLLAQTMMCWAASQLTHCGRECSQRHTLLSFRNSAPTHGLGTWSTH